MFDFKLDHMDREGAGAASAWRLGDDGTLRMMSTRLDWIRRRFEALLHFADRLRDELLEGGSCFGRVDHGGDKPDVIDCASNVEDDLGWKI